MSGMIWKNEHDMNVLISNLVFDYVSFIIFIAVFVS